MDKQQWAQQQILKYERENQIWQWEAEMYRLIGYGYSEEAIDRDTWIDSNNQRITALKCMMEKADSGKEVPKPVNVIPLRGGRQ